MAEGFAKKYIKNYNIFSAGTNPDMVSTNAIICMKEIGVDISKNISNKVEIEQLSKYNYIITLCGDAMDKCVNLSELNNTHIHWDIYDPAIFDGTSSCSYEYSNVRNMIYEKIKLFKIELDTL